jgi:hypothetical protein
MEGTRGRSLLAESPGGKKRNRLLADEREIQRLMKVGGRGRRKGMAV